MYATYTRQHLSHIYISIWNHNKSKCAPISPSSVSFGSTLLMIPCISMREGGAAGLLDIWDNSGLQDPLPDKVF